MFRLSFDDMDRVLLLRLVDSLVAEDPDTVHQTRQWISQFVREHRQKLIPFGHGVSCFRFGHA